MRAVLVQKLLARFACIYFEGPRLFTIESEVPMTMRLTQAVLFTFALALCGQLQAQLLSPTDPIVGGEVVGGQFVVGVAGTAAGVNNWPGGESPDHAIDGVGQKYLNFAEENTGFIVTPGISIVDQITLWTANDAVERDPASFELWGTNAAIGASPIDLASFTMIASGALALPASRNAGGAAALDAANSQVVDFDNSNAYSSYLVMFPTVKNATANSMQIAEVQLGGVAIPEPSSIVLAALFAGLAFMRYRR
jgi:hypothetical protein